jgi:hypothetical protein
MLIGRDCPDYTDEPEIYRKPPKGYVCCENVGLLPREPKPESERLLTPLERIAKALGDTDHGGSP